MPDGSTSDPQAVLKDAIAPAQPLPPGSPPLPLGATGQTVTTGQRLDYTALGATQAKADFAAAAGNGGWAFNPEAMDKVIQELEDSLDGDFRKAQNHGQMMALMTPPGGENVSTNYVSSVVKTVVAHNEFVKGAVDYVTAYLETLKKVRAAYVNQDHAAMDDLRKTGNLPDEHR